MKVVVLYDDPREQADAENLAEVLEVMAPQLVHAKIDSRGELSMTGWTRHIYNTIKAVALQATEVALRSELLFGR